MCLILVRGLGGYQVLPSNSDEVDPLGPSVLGLDKQSGRSHALEVGRMLCMHVKTDSDLLIL